MLSKEHGWHVTDHRIYFHGCHCMRPRISTQNIKRLLKPRHIAFIGGRGIGASIEVTRSLGFEGQIWAVNPTYPEIADLKCFRDISELPEPPDASYVAVPRDAAIDIIGGLSTLGAGGAVCFASGFAEIGDEGQELQQKLTDAAGGIAMMGPNCTGFINYLDRAAVITGPQGGSPVATGAALLAQSGTITLNSGMSDRSLDLSHIISVGNEALVQVADFVEVLIEDERVTAIGVALETIRDIDAFAVSARQARIKGIPIVVLKTGRSELSVQSALSHTGALAGADQIYDDFFERLGIVRVETLPVFLETLKFLTVAGRPEGRRTFILTCSGFEAGMAADAAERAGLDLPPIPEPYRTVLQQQLPSFAKAANPLDYHMAIWGNRQAQERCFRASFAAPYDAAIVVANYPRQGTRDTTDWTALVDGLIDARAGATIPLAFMSSLPEGLPEDVRRRLKAHGIAPIQGIDDGLLALAAAAKVTERWKAAAQAGRLELLKNRHAGESSQNAQVLDEWTGKQLLQGFGVPIPRGHALKKMQLPEWTSDLHFPIVVKGLSAHLPHKSEAGAIELGVGKDAEIPAIAATIEQRVRVRTGIELQEYLIEEMVAEPVAELIVGVRWQPPFGLALLIGAGGVFAEVTRDTQELILPASSGEILRALGRLKLSRILRGYRGKPEADMQALVACILSIADFAIHHQDRLVELDVNPLLVLAKGRGVVAVDALVVMAPITSV